MVRLSDSATVPIFDRYLAYDRCSVLSEAPPPGGRHEAEQAKPIVQRLREAQPGANFTISMKVQWDEIDHGVLRALVDYYAAIGMEHLLVVTRIEMWMIGRR